MCRGRDSRRDDLGDRRAAGRSAELAVTLVLLVSTVVFFLHRVLS